jgi:hypothetical protein
MDYYLNRNIEPIIYINDEGLECLEEWKYVAETDNLYKVSDLGRIMSLKRKKPLIVKPMLNRGGYLKVDVYKHCTSYSLHRIVAIAFIDNPDKKPQVNHKNHIRTDNSKNNLEWVSALENCSHSITSKKGSSNFLGVYADKKKWTSSIRFNGKKNHLGNFNTEEEAYEARVKFEKENNIQNKYL